MKDRVKYSNLDSTMMTRMWRQLFLALALGGAVYAGLLSESPSTALRTPAHAGLAPACSAVLSPQIDGPWWQVAGNPMDHKYATEKQEPVDFAVWQAADGSWQFWSCIRNTTAGGKEGKTRFFYGWKGKNLTDADWRPKGIAMEADPSLGETPGGLQAPHVVKVGDTYHLFYGDWVNICHATSKDGKNFTRVIQDERYFVCTLSVAAPEIIHHEGRYYIAALNEGALDGIRIARLTWVKK